MECGKYIECEIKGKPYRIPNSWETLSPSQFTYVAGLLLQYGSGKLSMSDVRLYYIVHMLDIDLSYVPRRHADAIAANLYILLSHVTFIFNLKYKPDIWDNLSQATRNMALKTDPHLLPDTPEVRLLRTQPYTYVVDACFAVQLLPFVEVFGRRYQGYTINTDCGQLSTSLTARQYVDASECLSGLSANTGLLSLLAAILYCPGIYNNSWAHDNARHFASLPVATLEAVSLNFQAFVLLLFRKTHFSILWSKAKKDSQESKITSSIDEALLNLSADGYGDHEKIDAMPLIKYLEILRNKKIQAVRTMHAAEMKMHDIMSKTGLDEQTIKNIL